MVDVSNYDSDNSDNDDDPYEAENPEASDPEDSVDITLVDDQESECAGVSKQEPILEGVSGESEE